MNIAQWLARTALEHPDRPALFKGAVCDADYAEFARRARAIGAALKVRGIAPGDRVALFMGNSTEYLECLYGVWWAGAAVVPINAKLHAQEAAWICANSGAKLIFADDASSAALAPAVGALPLLSIDGADFSAMRCAVAPPSAPEPRAMSDLAWLFYTSGTTGRPKGVMISHQNLVVMSLCYLGDVDTVRPDDVELYAAPMSHGAGLYNFIHVRMAARHAVPLSGGFDGDEVLDLSRALGNVSMFAAPTMVKRLVDAARRRGEAGEGIRTIVYGGGPMYTADILDAMEVMGQRFVQIYGQGESPMTITALGRAWHARSTTEQDRARLASVGTAQSAVEIRITGADGKVLPPRQPGEIEVRGTAVMLGYWNNPEATADTIREGWLRTGDVGWLDEAGFLTLSDRSKDVIISGGTNIYPREVEEALLTHGAVSEVAVIGAKDAEWGESVLACVVLKAGGRADAAALDAHCLDFIARFKRPKRYVFLDALPKNNYGKVLKTELRKLIAV